MTQEPGRIHVDSDWKQEAQREKERLAASEAAAPKKGEAEAQPAGVLDIINLLATHAAIGLGGMQAPGGERMPPDLEMARFHIDLLMVLDEKTKGNLTPEEKRVLDSVNYQLQVGYVELAGAAAKAVTDPGKNLKGA